MPAQKLIIQLEINCTAKNTEESTSKSTCMYCMYSDVGMVIFYINTNSVLNIHHTAKMDFFHFKLCRFDKGKKGMIEI
jgi:hypothetical protein